MRPTILSPSSGREGRRRFSPLLGVLLAMSALIGISAPAVAAPANDDIGSPRTVGALPWTDDQDTSAATTGTTDPDFCFGGSPDRATVWFRFTAPQSRRYQVSTGGSDYDTTLYVGTPSGGGISVIDCTDDSPGLDLQSRVLWQADAGTTYLIMVGTCCGGGTPGETGGGGHLVITVDDAPPAPTIALTVAATGSVSRSGVATVHGVVTCTGHPDEVGLDARVREQVGRRLLTGFGGTQIDGCSPEGIAWQVTATADDGTFGSGKVKVRVLASACNALECAQADVERTVTLKR
jgi:hypothetical protein